MTTLALALLLAAAPGQPVALPFALSVAPANAGAKSKGAAPDLAPRALVPDHGGDTRCAACHTAEGWKDVKFAHDRTGFPLEGRHADAQCRACHATGTFAEPVPRACAACHRDVHQGRLGQRCGDCHDPTAWATPTFGADAHRRTNFPLTGRHAFIPCTECHGDRRDRGFQRPTPRCIGCHEADWQRAGAGGAAVDHAAAGFPQECRTCHGAWRFSPAGLPAHEACFSLRSGPHGGVRCLDCHRSIPPVDYTQPFTCATDTADCMRCHGNPAGEHSGVPGYAPINRKCYECHRFSRAP